MKASIGGAIVPRLKDMAARCPIAKSTSCDTAMRLDGKNSEALQILIGTWTLLEIACRITYNTTCGGRLKSRTFDQSSYSLERFKR